MIIQNYSDLAKDRGKINALKILTAGLESAMPKNKNHRFQIFQAGHPTPDKTSVRAARYILKFLHQRNKDELVIFLVSGGSSALLALPDGITLNDKIRFTKELLVSGATIQELNCVRKHLSKIKGGRLIEGMKCDAVSLVISDVMGDDLSSIASGTTYFDKTKFADALKILKKPHHIVLTNRDCLQAMQKKSKQLGVSFKTISISGDIAKATSKLVSLIPKKKNSCIIFGGETTVKVKGSGKGGRNQELVLRILEKIQ